MDSHKLSVASQKFSVCGRKESTVSRKRSIVDMAEDAGIDKNTIILTVK